MKKQIRFSRFLSLVITLSLIAAQTTIAQQHNHQPRRIPDAEQTVQMIDEIAEILSLTEEQKEKMLAIHTDHFEKLETLHRQNQHNREAMHEAMKNLHDEMKAQIAELLTNEQQELFDNYMREKQPHPHPGDGRSDHSHPGHE